MTNRMTRSHTNTHRYTEKCVLVANFSGPSLSHGQHCELSPYSWPWHCNNDSDSCHYQEEEKLKLGCESAFNGKPNKTEEQQTDRRLMWTMGNPEGGQRWKDCRGSKSQQQVLNFIIRAHAWSSRHLLHYAWPINSVLWCFIVNQLPHKKHQISFISLLHPLKKAIFTSKMVHNVHVLLLFCHGKLYALSVQPQHRHQAWL